jgi:hypothetical protein
MWKSHFIVDSKGIVFHRGCGNRCGKKRPSVENPSPEKVFHISTGTFFDTLWKCGKVQTKLYYIKSLTENRTVENFSGDN